MLDFFGHHIEAVHDEIICTDEDHFHNSPVQEMIGIEVNGHWVEATKDGEVFHVRVDGDNQTAQGYLSEQQAFTFVKAMTDNYVEDGL